MQRPVLKRKIPKSTGWSPERRLAQSARTSALRIWTKSTGPRTTAGKARSGANSLKSGFFCAPRRMTKRVITHALRAQARWVQNVNMVRRLERHGKLPTSIYTGLQAEGNRATLLLNFICMRAF